MDEQKINYYGIVIVILGFIIVAMLFMGGFSLKADAYTWFGASLCPLRNSLTQYKSIVGWDVYRAGGQPVFSQPEVPFELSYLFYLIFNDANIALTLGIMIYVSFGIAGMYLLSFKLTKNNKSAILSSIFFFMNGFFVSLYANGKFLNFITPYSFLPWIFLLYLNMNKDIRKIIINSIFIGILLAIAFLAEGIQFVTYILFTLPIFMVIDLFILKESSASFLFKLKKLVIILLVVLITFSGLSAFKLYPGMKFIEKTNRNSEFTLDQFIDLKLEMKDLLSLKVHQIGENWMRTAITPAILVLIGLFLGFKKKRFLKFFILAILFIIITANLFSIANLLILLPIINKAKSLMRFAGIYQFSVGILIGLSFSYISQSLAKKGLKKYFSLLFILIVILFSFELIYIQTIKNDLNVGGKFLKSELNKYAPLKYMSSIDSERHRIHVLGTDWVQGGRGEEHLCSVGIETMDWVFSNAWLVDYTTFTMWAGTNLEQAAKLWGILNTKYISAEDPKKINPVYTKAIYSYKNDTDYYVPHLKLIKKFPSCEKCMPDITQLYENEKFLPRIFLVNKSILIVGEKDKLYNLYNFLLLNDNFDPKSTVLINKDDIKNEDLNKYTAIIIASQISPQEIQKLQQFKNLGGKLFPDIFSNENQIDVEKLDALLQKWNKEAGIKEFKEVYYSPNHRIYETKENLKGFAVVSENFYTYKDEWLASLNSKDKEIYSANFIVSAVYLDKEKGKLEFKYNPVYFKIGGIASLATLLLICAYLVYAYKKSKITQTA